MSEKCGRQTTPRIPNFYGIIYASTYNLFGRIIEGYRSDLVVIQISKVYYWILAANVVN
jgi:hypothetical protein